MRALIVLAVAATACASTARFKDQPPVWRIDDTRDIAEPEEREFLPIPYFVDILAFDRLNRTLELPDLEPAHNTNSLDEVPDSTWFTNRIGRHPVSPGEAARAASAVGPPQLPITVVAGKSGGGNPGFFARDTRGYTYLIKFDTKDNPEMQTATGVIVNRIFWTLGYNVPNDNVFTFARADLHLSPDAKVGDELKRKRAMTEEDVEEILATAPCWPDGSYRALASEFLPGKPVGGFAYAGVRDDDANDVVAHEHRRELRGLRVLSAWVNHTDMKEDNTLDMWTEEDGRRFVRHYLIDFGEAFGSHAAEKGHLQDGWEHTWDWQKNPRAMFSFGLWLRPWEEIVPAPWLSVGPFVAEPFEPELWRSAYPFFPFFEADAADSYWAAKIVMRFDRPLLAAVVAEGRFSDPEAAAYVVDVLLARRDAVGRAYLEAVTPLDDWSIGAGGLCATDLGVSFGLADVGVVERLDEYDDPMSEHMVDGDGRVCLPIPDGDDYQIYRLRTRRGPEYRPALQVHFKGGERARILGLIRLD
jgi:hypothetical protein